MEDAIDIEARWIVPDSVDVFWNQFNGELRDIKDNIEDTFTNKTDATLALLKKRITNIQRFATDSRALLSQYDVRRTQELIENTNSRYKQVEASIKPKKSFSFSRRKVDDSSGSNDSIKIVNTEPSGEKVEAYITALEIPIDIPGYFYVRGKSDEEITITKENLTTESAKNLVIANTSRCLISVQSTLGSVRIQNSVDCIVFLGPVSTSVYLESCQNCTMFICSHQLRIHNTYNSNLYVRVNSHPIIEQCSNVAFAPYSCYYPGLDHDIMACNLSSSVVWDKVVDFRWHRSTPSPNWFLTPEHSRLQATPNDFFATMGWSVAPSRSPLLSWAASTASTAAATTTAAAATAATATAATATAATATAHAGERGRDIEEEYPQTASTMEEDEL